MSSLDIPRLHNDHITVKLNTPPRIESGLDEHTRLVVSSGPHRSDESAKGLNAHGLSRSCN
jgi:hypothetical protein